MIEAGGIRMPGNPVKIDGYNDPAERAGAPELDQHGAAVRKEFGGATPRCTSQLMVVRARLRRLSEDWPKVLGTAAVLGGFDEEGRRADAGGLVRCGVGRQTA